ncbi:MAG: hypothetical protein VYA34_11385 [Myxococcota bacterium]|nr:hypothetical protein [Myxococcota bacterium]
MQLLTSLAVAGPEAVELLRFIPEEQRERINEKATSLLKLEGEKRIPFVVSQLKELLSGDNIGFDKIEPSWILDELLEEEPISIGILLITLPPNTTKICIKMLPDTIREQLPPRSAVIETPPLVQKAALRQFESRFTPMPCFGALREFQFQDLLRLESSDWHQLLNVIGKVEVGQAFVSVGKMALVDFCRQLSATDAENLLATVKRHPEMTPEEIKTGQRFLSRIAGSFKAMDELFSCASLWRLAKATYGEPKRFTQQIALRIPRKWGIQYLDYLEKIPEMDDLNPQDFLNYQDSILIELIHLIHNQAINFQMGKANIVMNTPDRYKNASTANDN